MEKKEITAKIIKILTRHFEIKKEHIKPGAELIKDLQIDSLDIIDLLVALERNFGIKAEVEDMAKIKTVSDLCEFISSKKSD